MKLSKIIFVPCAVLLFSSASVFAQGALLDKGQSGSSFIVGYAKSNSISLLQGSFINTYRGFLDFGISMGSAGRTVRFDDINSFGLHLELIPVRESSISGGFPLNFSGFGIWTTQKSANSSSYGFGGSIFKRANLGEKSFIVLNFAFAKVWPISFESDGEMITSLDLPIVLMLDKKRRFSITPSYFNNGTEKGLGISVGLTLLGKVKNK